MLFNPIKPTVSFSEKHVVHNQCQVIYSDKVNVRITFNIVINISRKTFTGLKQLGSI